MTDEGGQKVKGKIATAKTPEEYLAQVDEGRRADVAALDRLIRKAAPKLEPVVQNGVLGYGPFHYKYASGREGDACRLSIASNAQYISLYVLATDGEQYVAEKYKEQLPKAKIGKSCVRFKKLADLDAKALEALIKETARSKYGGN